MDMKAFTKTASTASLAPVVQVEPEVKKMKAFFNREIPLSCSKCSFHVKHYVFHELVADERNPTRPFKQSSTLFGCPNPACGNFGINFASPVNEIELVEVVNG